MKLGRARKEYRPARPQSGVNRRRGAETNDADSPRGPLVRWSSVLAFLRLLGSVGAVAALLVGALLAYRYACNSKYFAATDIRVSGNRSVTTEEIVAAAELGDAPNLFHIDVNIVRRKLLGLPWIANALVTTRLPRTVSIEVEERRAAATLVLEVPYLVDESGDIFKRFTTKDIVVAPVVTGFEREEFTADEPLASERLRDALDLARRYRKTSLEQTAPLAEVHRESDGGFSIVIGKEGVYVKLGKGPYRHKLARLATLLSRLQRDGRVPAIVYLDNEVRPDRITVTPRPAPNDVSVGSEVDGDEKKVVENLIR